MITESQGIRTMITSIQRKQTTLAYRVFSAFIAFTFVFTSIVPPQRAYAQTVVNLPPVGAMLPLSPAYTPVMIKGINIDPQNPLQMDFIIDTGDTDLKGDLFNDEATKLIKYFLASLTIKEEEMWVNLSPYEKNRIIPEAFSQTEMGRDLLVQDYLLKQLTASLIYPEDDLGKKFWDRVYAKAQEQFGTTEIPMNTFNKVWIVPESAQVFEHEKGAFVVSSHLKIMLEEDYLALESNRDSTKHGLGNTTQEDLEIISGVSSEIIREILIPEIEHEVNNGETFANLRQIFNSMILATWYKQNLKESLLSKVYVDQNKLKGVDLKDTSVHNQIYDQYIEAFKKGVYNYIKEDYDPATKEIIPRKYFSGGFANNLNEDIIHTETVSSPLAINRTIVGDQSVVTAKFLANGDDYQVEMFNELAAASSPVSEDEAMAETEFHNHSLAGKTDQSPEEYPTKRLLMDPALMVLDKSDPLTRKMVGLKINDVLEGHLKTIKEIYLSGTSLSPLERFLLENVAEEISTFVSKISDDDQHATIGQFFELTALLSFALFADAWLTPTWDASPLSDRGLTQGEVIPHESSEYARSNLNSIFFEELLNAEIFHGQKGIVFRNIESAFSETIDTLIRNSQYYYGGEREIYVSENILSRFSNYRQRLKDYGKGGGKINFGKYSSEELLDYIFEEQPDFVVVHESDIEDVNGFLLRFREMQRQLPKVERIEVKIFIVSNTIYEPASEIEDLVEGTGISLSILYDVQEIFKNLNQSPFGLLAPIAFLSTYIVGSRDDDFFDELSDLRTYGSRIDLFSLMHLSLLVKEIDNSKLNSKEYKTPALVTDEGFNKISDYQELYHDLETVMSQISPKGEFAQSMKQKIQERINQNAHILDHFLEGSDVAQVSTAIHEYRGLLKFYTYFRWLQYRQVRDFKQTVFLTETRVEAIYNDFNSPIFDRKGQALPQGSLLFSSSMGAVYALLHFLTAENDERGILVGNNSYFENDTLIEEFQAEGTLHFKSFAEGSRIIDKQIASGQYRAMFFDPIANQVKLGDEGFESKKDVPVVRLKTILNRLLSQRFRKPFYFAIDTTAFGPTFQISDFIKSPLPANLHIILFGSLQKLYQHGLELTTGGGVTVISSNATKNSRIIEKLKKARDFIGMGLSLLSYIALDILWKKPEEIAKRIEGISRNAEEIARFLEAEFKKYDSLGEALHPALSSHIDHQVWLQNGALDLPWVWLRLNTDRFSSYENFKAILSQKLRIVGLEGLYMKGSFGFTKLTAAYIEGWAFRLSLADFNQEQIDKIKQALSLALRDYYDGSELKPDSEQADPATQAIIPRKYFSGGFASSPLTQVVKDGTMGFQSSSPVGTGWKREYLAQVGLMPPDEMGLELAYNPAALKISDNFYLIVYRGVKKGATNEDGLRNDNTTEFYAAFSYDGKQVDEWIRDPIMVPGTNEDEKNSIEDPRLVPGFMREGKFFPDLKGDTVAIFYVGFNVRVDSYVIDEKGNSKKGAGLAIPLWATIPMESIKKKDFSKLTRQGRTDISVMFKGEEIKETTNNKDMTIFPESVWIEVEENGVMVRKKVIVVIDRPMIDKQRHMDIRISWRDEEKGFGGPWNPDGEKILLKAEFGTWKETLGAGGTPVETANGWLFPYHGTEYIENGFKNVIETLEEEKASPG